MQELQSRILIDLKCKKHAGSSEILDFNALFWHVTCKILLVFLCCRKVCARFLQVFSDIQTVLADCNQLILINLIETILIMID